MLIKVTLQVIMNKRLMGVIGLLFSLLIVSVNASAQDATNKLSLTEQERTWIAEHPVVRTSSNTSYAPFDFMGAGQPAGFSIDYLNLVGTKVGLKFNFVNYETWSELLEGAKDREVELVHTISKNEEREKYFIFTEPYFNSPIVNFGRYGSPKISSIKDLTDKRIGIIKSHIIGETYKKKYSHANLVEFDNSTEAINALLLNEIDVYTDCTSSGKVGFLSLYNKRVFCSIC